MLLKNKAVISTATAAVTLCIVAAVIIFAAHSNNAGNGDNGKASVSDTTSSYTQATVYAADKPEEKPTGTSQAATEAATEKETASEKEYEAPTMSVEISTELYRPTVYAGTEKPTEPDTSPEASENPTEVGTVLPEPTEAATEDSETDFETLIARGNYSLEDIKAENCGQVVVADVYGAQANIYIFTQEDDVWKNEIRCYGWTGRNGTGEKQSADDGITPTGFYGIGDAFFTDEQPATWLNTFRITDTTYWVTDRESDMYNKKVEADSDEFSSSKHMIEDEALRYGCVIEYNTVAVEKSKGSAVFMECGDTSTDGSIALTEEDMLKYLNVLNATKNPHILIF